MTLPSTALNASVNSQGTIPNNFLFSNPFYVLGATTRDDRLKILQLAEERALTGNAEICARARADLTNPRNRISAELGWLPGVAPTKAIQLLKLLRDDPPAIRAERGLPALAHANLMAASWTGVHGTDAPAEIAGLIQETAILASRLIPATIMRDVNEDRAVSGFPPAASDQIDGELAERMRIFRTTIIDGLNTLPTSTLVEAMTIAVASCTNNGENHAPPLLDELVDAYEVEAQNFITEETSRAITLIEATRNRASVGEPALAPFLRELAKVLRNWVKVARPIQISAKARGINHRPSIELAETVRQLSVELFNKHNMLESAKQINVWLGELFEVLPDTGAQLQDDAVHLAKLSKELEDSKKQHEEWEKAITFRAEIGLIKKDILTIAPSGVTWNDQHYPLEGIKWIRWGGVTQTVFLIQSTTYTVAFGDFSNESVVTLTDKNVYANLTDKLWRAVGWRLISEMLNKLKAGKGLPFANSMIFDDGIELPKRKWFGKPEMVRWSWDQVKIWDLGGNFHIGVKDRNKDVVQLSYKDIANVWVLERIIRSAFKKPGLHRLSELLETA